jgi:hypothetical protein
MTSDLARTILMIAACVLGAPLSTLAQSATRPSPSNVPPQQQTLGNIDGQVQAAGGAVVDSTVTLWVASAKGGKATAGESGETIRPLHSFRIGERFPSECHDQRDDDSGVA